MRIYIFSRFFFAVRHRIGELLRDVKACKRQYAAQANRRTSRRMASDSRYRYRLFSPPLSSRRFSLSPAATVVLSRLLLVRVTLRANRPSTLQQRRPKDDNTFRQSDAWPAVAAGESPVEKLKGVSRRADAEESKYGSTSVRVTTAIARPARTPSRWCSVVRN